MSALQVWQATPSHAIRSVNVCFSNSTSWSYKIEWTRSATIDGGTGSRSSTVSQGQQTCAEGDWVSWTSAIIGTSGSKRAWAGWNRVAGQPKIALCKSGKLSDCFGFSADPALGFTPYDERNNKGSEEWAFGQNEHICFRPMASKDTWFRISRESNDDWIQFRVLATSRCR